MQGDMRERADIAAALRDIDVVFHQAAYGGYMPEIAKYVHVNSFGTAQMLEIIREENLPIKKVVVASSQAVYSEGAATCPQHGSFFPPCARSNNCARGDWSVHCPKCGEETTSAPTPEEAPVGGETVYGLTKVDQEKLVLLWGKQAGIPTVALRYSCTYGPRQSIFNPYTGVIAIFCTRLLNDLPPVLYEDGEQTRDFSFVEDIARANLTRRHHRQTRWPPSKCGQQPRCPDSRSGRADCRCSRNPNRAGGERGISPGRNAPSHQRHRTHPRGRLSNRKSICRQASGGIWIGSARRPT